jgi:hypothetical protein
MPAPRSPDRNNLAMYVVLCHLTPDMFYWLRTVRLFHLDLGWCRGLTRRVIVRRAILPALLLDTVVGHVWQLGVRTLTGRKDRGRRDRPVRHGARPVEVAASARAMSRVVVMSTELMQVRGSG